MMGRKKVTPSGHRKASIDPPAAGPLAPPTPPIDKKTNNSSSATSSPRYQRVLAGAPPLPCHHQELQDDDHHQFHTVSGVESRSELIQKLIELERQRRRRLEEEFRKRGQQSAFEAILASAKENDDSCLSSGRVRRTPTTTGEQDRGQDHHDLLSPVILDGVRAGGSAGHQADARPPVRSDNWCTVCKKCGCRFLGRFSSH